MVFQKSPKNMKMTWKALGKGSFLPVGSAACPLSKLDSITHSKRQHAVASLDFLL